MTTETKTAATLTGHEAIAYAEAHGLALGKYTDPTEGAREGLTVEEARRVAAEDPGLIYVARTHYAAIGSDLMAVYGVGETEEAAIADARRESGEADAHFEAVPMTAAAYAHVQGPGGGAPSAELVVSRQGVSLRDEEA